jgi:hypothetical protein
MLRIDSEMSLELKSAAVKGKMDQARSQLSIIQTMNWKDYLNSSRSSINHIIKTTLFVLIFFTTGFTQIENEEEETIKNDSVFVPTKSPWTAVLWSAVIPGAGQIYNESYWKAPIIWGVLGWLGYNWVQNNNSYNEYKDLYSQTGDEDYRRLRTFYLDQRDLFTIYIALTYILNLVDAYVDAQLFDFSVDEDFLLGSPRLNLRINLP